MNKQKSEKAEATSAVDTIVRRTEPLNEVTLFGVNYDCALNDDYQPGWCHRCGAPEDACMCCQDDFIPCSNCDGHDACWDFGCAFEQGIIKPEW